MRGLHNRRDAGRLVEFARPQPILRDVVICPGCGGETRDAGANKRPRWTCLRGTCPFVYGWELEFASPLDPDRKESEGDRPRNRPMIAIPFTADGRALRAGLAVPWPRRAR